MLTGYGLRYIQKWLDFVFVFFLDILLVILPLFRIELIFKNTVYHASYIVVQTVCTMYMYVLHWCYKLIHVYSTLVVHVMTTIYI